VTDDAFGDGRASKLTFLIYLNGSGGVDGEGGHPADGEDSSCSAQFVGGSTTFFRSIGVAGGDLCAAERAVEARAVAPAMGDNFPHELGEVYYVNLGAGAVLCFPHGDASGSLVHEGSAVVKGFKYVSLSIFYLPRWWHCLYLADLCSALAIHSPTILHVHHSHRRVIQKGLELMTGCSAF
jgi:hypothetical protein